MSIQIHSKTFSLTDEQKEYIQKKCEKILHYSGRADDASSFITVEVNHEETKDKKNHIHCKIHASIPQDKLYAESYTHSVESAVDECEEKLARQVRKYKVRMQH